MAAVDFGRSGPGFPYFPGPLGQCPPAVYPEPHDILDAGPDGPPVMAAGTNGRRHAGGGAIEPPVATAPAAKPPEPATMRGLSMPGRIVSYVGSTLLTGGGLVVAEGGVADNSTAINTGIGAIILGLASFLAPHVSAWLKEWRDERKLARDERKKNFQGQIDDLKDDINQSDAEMAIVKHLLNVALTVIHANRQWMIEQHIATGKPLPEGFGRREFDTGAGTIESLMATQPSRTVADVLDRKRSLPTPDPASKARHDARPEGATNTDWPTIPRRPVEASGDAAGDAGRGER